MWLAGNRLRDQKLSYMERLPSPPVVLRDAAAAEHASGAAAPLMRLHAQSDGFKFMFTTPAKLAIFLPFPIGAPAPAHGIVSGVLRVSSSEPLNVRGLRVRFSGDAHVRWTTKTHKGQTHTHDAKQDLIVTPWCALFGEGEERSGADYVLLPGVRDFPFLTAAVSAGFSLPSTFSLPPPLDVGRVRYAVDAWLDVRGRPDLITSAELICQLPSPPPPALTALPMPQRAIVPLQTCCFGDVGVARLVMTLPPGGHVLPAKPRGAPLLLPLFAGVGVAPARDRDLRLPKGSRRAPVTVVRRVVCRADGAVHIHEDEVSASPLVEVLLLPAAGSAGAQAAGKAAMEGADAWDGVMALQQVACLCQDLSVPSFSCSVLEVSYRLRMHLPWRRLPWRGPTLEVPLWVGTSLNIAGSDTGGAVCVAAGAPSAVVAALTTHAGVAAVCEKGCWALANFAVSDASSADCVASGAPAAVVAALTTHAGVAAVCEEGCAAVANIALRDAGRAACVAARAPAAVVAALTTHASVAAVCEEGSKALINMCYSDAGEAACIAAGASVALIATLATHAGSEGVCLYAAWALLSITGSNLGTSPQSAHLFAVEASGVAPRLAEALVREAGMFPFARAKARAALEKLGYNDAGIKVR